MYGICLLCNPCSFLYDPGTERVSDLPYIWKVEGKTHQDLSNSLFLDLSWSCKMMEISRAPIHSQGKKKMYLIKERSLFLKDPKIWRARAIQWGENFKEEGGKLCEPMWDSVLTFCGFHPWFPMHHCFPRQAIETRIFLPLSYHVRATDHKAVLPLPLSDGRWLTSTWEENLSHTYATVRPRKRWKSPSWGSLPSLLTEQSAFFFCPFMFYSGCLYLNHA